MRALDLTGQTFGRLTVVERVANSVDGRPRFRCLCACGGEAVAYSNNLRRGNTQSCGCYKRERAKVAKTTHDRCHSLEYGSWRTMVSRCLRPTDTNYQKYGGRGITVCDRWRYSFANFFADMGPRPSAKHSIERNDNNGDYEPDNCRWATAKEQANNRRPRVATKTAA